MSQSGFVARGAFAVVIPLVLGVARLIHTATGKAASSDYATFGWILVLSAIATLIAMAVKSEKRPGN